VDRPPADPVLAAKLFVELISARGFTVPDGAVEDVDDALFRLRSGHDSELCVGRADLADLAYAYAAAVEEHRRDPSGSVVALANSRALAATGLGFDNDGVLLPDTVTLRPLLEQLAKPSQA
jgi:hypothetical protein